MCTLLYAIYPTDEDVHAEALAMKIEPHVLAVLAFKSESAARRFMDSRHMSPEHFAVRELTVDEFQKTKTRFEGSLDSLTVLMKIAE